MCLQLDLKCDKNALRTKFILFLTNFFQLIKALGFIKMVIKLQLTRFVSIRVQSKIWKKCKGSNIFLLFLANQYQSVWLFSAVG